VHPTLRLEPLFTWLFGDYLAVDTWQRKTWSALVVGMLVVLLVFGFRWVERIEDGSGPRSSIRWRVPRHTRRRTEGHEPDLEDCS
jgi:hypothetical protein